MDTSNRRTPQVGEPSMDWGSQLQPNARQRVVNRTIELLKSHLPDSGQAALQEVKKIAISFEEKVYTSATSELDYLRKLSLKMQALETNLQNTMAKYLQLNSGKNSNRPRDPGSFGMQPQVPNQGQSLSMPVSANQSQARQRFLSRNIENNIPPAGVQSSAGLPPSSGLAQAPISTTIGQNPNMQNMSGTSQTSNMISNCQSQMQGGQQIVPQQQWQEQGYIPKLVQSTLEQQQRQPTQSQSSQKSVKNTLNLIKPSVVQSYFSSLQQNQQSSIHQSTQSMLQQHSQSVLGGPQQANMNALPLQSGANVVQTNINSLHSSSGMLQFQHTRQEQEQQMHQNLLNIRFQQQQMLERQQYQQRLQQQANQLQLQHQAMQQQLQKQLQPQEKHKLPVQLQVHEQQTPQVHQIHDVNDLKMREGMDVTPRVVLHQHTFADSPQQLKAGSPVPTSSTTQLRKAASPQISQHSSRQADQQNLLTHPKAGIPVQAASSPVVIPSPSTPKAPSPMPGDSEKPSSLSNAGNVGHQQATGVGALVQSVAIGTPRISAFPSLFETREPDVSHVNALSTLSGNLSVTEQTLACLIKVVKSMTPNALFAAVSDMSSVVNMIDIIPGSPPGNGSRAAVGEDLVAMTKCRLQERNVMTPDGTNGTKRRTCYTSDVPSGSTNDSFTPLTNSETSDPESAATSRVKRPRTKANYALLKEIREINRQLIDTVVGINDEDVVDPSAAATSEGDEGTIFKCSFGAVALSPNLKSQYVSGKMSKIQPLKLLVPTNYPESSPVLLDKFPVEVSKEYEDLSVKAKSRLSNSLRSISQPASLGEIAKTWDVCARAVISENAQQRGGGSFSSKYGTWENCLSTT